MLSSVTVIEHATPLEARESLVDFLTTVMAPTLPTASERGINAVDVGFAGFSDERTDVTFARATTLIRVQSIGDKAASVKEIAETLDRHVREHVAYARLRVWLIRSQHSHWIRRGRATHTGFIRAILLKTRLHVHRYWPIPYR
jgi:hypothetical protein